MSYESNAVILCAKNEEVFIQNTVGMIIDGIQKGDLSHLVIVLDGCKDNTRKQLFDLLPTCRSDRRQLEHEDRAIRYDGNVALVNHTHSKGLGASFVDGIRTLHGYWNDTLSDDDVVVRMDVDLFKHDLQPIVQIIQEHRSRALPMLQGCHQECIDLKNMQYQATECLATGFRSFSYKKLEPLWAPSTPEEWARVFPSGFGMDAALNILMYSHYARSFSLDDFQDFTIPPFAASAATLFHAPPGRHESDNSQLEQRRSVFRRFLMPDNFYKKLLEYATSPKALEIMIAEEKLAFGTRVQELVLDQHRNYLAA